jgi:hypothetical protein
MDKAWLINIISPFASLSDKKTEKVLAINKSEQNFQFIFSLQLLISLAIIWFKTNM